MNEQLNEQLIYNATRTASLFHKDNSFVRVLIGPVGCGKSVSCQMDLLARMIQQAPSSHDGIRRSACAVIRNTYPELESTTIPLWKNWFPEKKFGRISFKTPIRQTMQFEDASFGKVQCEVYFLSLNSEEDIEKLRGMALTFAYIDEIQYLSERLVLAVLERLNRYPAQKEGASITWTGLVGGTNPPDDQHWIYRTFEEASIPSFKIFKYEPAVIKVDEPTAESFPSRNGTHYIKNVAADYVSIVPDKNYWANLVQVYSDDQIKVSLMGMYGTVADGKAVHPSYNDFMHYSENPLKANPLLTLRLGWDFGKTPACIIAQLSSKGQLVVLDELWSDHSDLRSFTQHVVIPFLNLHYPKWNENYISDHDPSGSHGNSEEGRSCQHILFECGIVSDGAKTNSYTPRKDALDYYLNIMVDGRPGFRLSSTCPHVRKGLSGHYMMERVRSNTGTTGDVYKDLPVKNIYSHACEALQYLSMRCKPDITKVYPDIKKAYSIQTGSFYSR
jgi:hypothetical protein